MKLVIESVTSVGPVTIAIVRSSGAYYLLVKHDAGNLKLELHGRKQEMRPFTDEYKQFPEYSSGFKDGALNLSGTYRVLAGDQLVAEVRIKSDLT